MMSWIGEWFAGIDWATVGAWAGLAWVYFGLSCVGPFFFPPFAICVYMTDGDLNTCSLGIWGNEYSEKNF